MDQGKLQSRENSTEIHERQFPRLMTRSNAPAYTILTFRAMVAYTPSPNISPVSAERLSLVR